MTTAPTLRQRALWFAFFVVSLFLLAPRLAQAQDDGPPRLSGTIEAQLDGRTVEFPLLKTDISGDVQGDLATVTVVQTFVNPGTRPLNATYLFPLNHEGAVYEMTMEVGDERIRAVIQETKQAEATFEKAKSEGKSAALLKQHRPNMFTQQLANLMPGLPIKVTLRYVQAVPKIDGSYELVMPLVVGPRFVPPPKSAPPDDDDTPRAPAPQGQWELSQTPDYPPVQVLEVPAAIEPERVSIKVRVNGGMPVREVHSDTHAIAAQAVSPNVWSVGLAQGRVIDNRDFVLRYTLAGARTQAGVLAQKDDRGGFLSLLIEPPAVPADSDIERREMVFLLDCSGSMEGQPLDASKAFMRQALRKLRAGDLFRIIRFGDSATEYSDKPLAATPDNIRRAIAYTDSLRGQGGTMAELGIRQALAAPPAEGRQRIVTFLTDGYIGNDYELIGLLRGTLGNARLYALGVGTGVNRFFLDEVGRVGRGFTRYMDPTENTEKVATELADRLQSPVLTGISIDWGELKAVDVYPQELPDLFAGQSLRVQARYEKAGDYTVRINGRSRGRAATMIVPVHLPAKGGDGGAVPLVWARAAVRDAMYQMSLPADLVRAMPGVAPPPPYDELKARVTDLGLKFSLVTRWTSFVAVSEKIYNAHPEDAADADVPLPMVKGVGPLAYGRGTATFTGAAGPESGSRLGLLLILLLVLLPLLHRPRVMPDQA